MPQYYQNQGFDEWFDRVYNSHFEKLYRYALIVTRDKQLAEEALSEVFHDLLEKKPDPNKIINEVAYLITSVKRRAILLLQKNQRQAHTLEDLSLIDHLDPSLLLEEKEISDIIEKEVKSLSPHVQQIYYEFTQQNRSQQDIAENLNLSRRTVETHIYQVVKKLKAAIKEYLD